MVGIRKVRMLVRNHSVLVSMTVWLFPVPVETMQMLMMLVMEMRMLVLQQFVRVFMFVLFGHVQPDPRECTAEKQVTFLAGAARQQAPSGDNRARQQERGGQAQPRWGEIPESSLISGTYGASRTRMRWIMSTREAGHRKLDILETLWTS